MVIRDTLATHEEKSVLLTIEENYDKLFPAEKKIADFIVRNPEQSVQANVSELANLSKVSDATVIRMCKHLGFEGHYQFRLKLARDLGHKKGAEMEVTSSDTASDIFRHLARRLVELGKTIDDGSLKTAVQFIKDAHYVHLVAVGNTNPFAQYLGYRLGRLGIRCTYDAIPEYFINHVNLASRSDLVIAISQSGSSKHVIRAVELAKRKGLKTITITGNEYSPLSRLADCLLVSSDEGRPFGDHRSNSRFNETAVIDVLIHVVASQVGVGDGNDILSELLFSENKL